MKNESCGGWPSRALTRHRLPHSWRFTGGLLRTLLGMFVGHSEIVAFLLFRFDADQPEPQRSGHFYEHAVAFVERCTRNHASRHGGDLHFCADSDRAKSVHRNLSFEHAWSQHGVAVHRQRDDAEIHCLQQRLRPIRRGGGVGLYVLLRSAVGVVRRGSTELLPWVKDISRLAPQRRRTLASVA